MRTRNTRTRSGTHRNVHHSVSVPDGLAGRRMSAAGCGRRRCVCALAKKNPSVDRRARLHVAGLVHVRRCRAHRRLQSPISAHVPIVAGGGETGLHAAGAHRATQENRTIHRRSRTILQGDCRKRCERQALGVGRRGRRRPHNSRHQRADAAWRLGLDPRGRHQAADPAAAARRHGRAAETPHRCRCGDRIVSFRDGSAARHLRRQRRRDAGDRRHAFRRGQSRLAVRDERGRGLEQRVDRSKDGGLRHR
jgi:hypothetical protein